MINCIRVMAHAGYLPGDSAARSAAAYGKRRRAKEPKPSRPHLALKIKIWHRRAHGCREVAKVLVERCEITRQIYSRLAFSVERRDAVIDVHLVGRLDK